MLSQNATTYNNSIGANLKMIILRLRGEKRLLKKKKRMRSDLKSNYQQSLSSF